MKIDLFPARRIKKNIHLGNRGSIRPAFIMVFAPIIGGFIWFLIIRYFIFW